ncbi:MAG: pyrroline-5-carboxylate reductase family protein, partial [Candidatus Omnitrophota bacterium]
IKDQIKDKLVISIAAGIPTGYIEKILGEVRVIRVMPNLPVRIGKGMTCLAKGKFATAGDMEFSQKLFNNLGQTMILPEEKIDAATAVAGSGPAFYCEFLLSHPAKDKADLRKEFIEISIAAAQKYWFTPEEARTAVKFMVAGTDGLLQEMKLSPSELEKQVASKGGTTEAGLKTYAETGSLEEAYKAAEKKAKELSKKE